MSFNSRFPSEVRWLLNYFSHPQFRSLALTSRVNPRPMRHENIIRKSSQWSYLHPHPPTFWKCIGRHRIRVQYKSRTACPVNPCTPFYCSNTRSLDPGASCHPTQPHKSPVRFPTKPPNHRVSDSIAHALDSADRVRLPSIDAPCRRLTLPQDPAFPRPHQ